MDWDLYPGIGMNMGIGFSAFQVGAIWRDLIRDIASGNHYYAQYGFQNSSADRSNHDLVFGFQECTPVAYISLG
jgi:hypothetical protein